VQSCMVARVKGQDVNRPGGIKVSCGQIPSLPFTRQICHLAQRSEGESECRHNIFERWSFVIFLTGIRIVVGLVLMLSGLAKAAGGPIATKKIILSYRLLPSSLASAAAYSIPTLELAAGTAIFMGLATRLAATISLIVLLAGTVGMVGVLIRKDRVICGCFGVYFERVVSWKTVVRNVILSACSVTIVLLGGGDAAISDLAPSRALDWLLLGIVTFGSIVIIATMFMRATPARITAQGR
jgi:hypothetical protein